MKYQEFISEFNNKKILGYELTKEIWLKNLRGSGDLLNIFISKSIKHNLNIFGALNDTISQGNSLSEAAVTVFCHYINSTKNVDNISPTIIENLATLKVSYSNAKHITHQLKLAKFVENKDDVLFKIFNNLLEIENNVKNQNIIYGYWIKQKRDPEQIKHLVPFVYLDKPAIHQDVQSFHTLELFTVKIASEYKVKTVHVDKAVQAIVNVYKSHYPLDISFSQEKDFDKGKFFFLLKDNTVGEKLHTCLTHFFNKFKEHDAWWDYPQQQQILKVDIKPILLAYKLNENLDNKPEQTKKHTLKEDIFSPYMEKETFLYNHPSLNEISEYAIKTDTFNFINADYFKKLSTLPHEWAIKLKEIKDFDELLLQDDLEDNDSNDEKIIKMEEYDKDIKELINTLPNIKIFNSLASDDNLNSLKFLNIKNPVVKISDEFFLETLKKNKIQSYSLLKKEIDNKNNEDYDSVFSFPKKDKNFLINFKQKSLPNFINIFDKLIASHEKQEALHLSEFFSASVGNQAGKLNDLGFSIFAHSLFSHDFEPYFLDPIITGIFTSENITNSKRQILIDEGSQFSSLLLENVQSLTLIEQPANKKKKSP